MALDDARGALANAQYYSTWLLRLEGAPREFAATLDNITACTGLSGEQRDKAKAYFAHTN